MGTNSTNSAIKKPLYPYTEWSIVEEPFQEDVLRRNESVFALGNGYIGMRGNLEEGFPGRADMSLNGTYINGFYDSEPIAYPEGAFAFAKFSQTMLNVTDAKLIALEVDGERFSVRSGKLLRHRRELDMKRGMLLREVEWEAPSGKRVRIASQRLVCLRRKHAAAFHYAATPLNFDGEIALISGINGEVRNQAAADDPRVGAGAGEQVLLVDHIDTRETKAWIKQHTRHTKFSLIAGIEHELEPGGSWKSDCRVFGQQAEFVFTVRATRGEAVRLTKYAAFFASKDEAQADLEGRMLEELDAARRAGFDGLVREQEEALAAFWRTADIRIEGDPALQQGVRFNAFQLFQSAGRDGLTNIGAKGLTGEGYEGHYFWDTETYILPFFIYTQPEIGRALLAYRYHTLDKARERAGQMSQRGAQYPWRTINGEEASAYFPAGTAQIHINADIIHGLKKYVEASGDRDFLMRYGAEMAFETARFWADIGYFNPRKEGKFCIDGVTGPDEYTAIVNNNAYTNMMAQENLTFAHETAGWMKENAPDAYAKLCERIGLREDEVAMWKEAAARMYIPTDEQLGIIAQDDTFLDKKMWDFASTPKAHYPLLLHYHPLVIYRHQVLKQADVVLALFLLSERFTPEEKTRNYAYYEPLTTHDSSLSPSIHSIIAAEIGMTEQAYSYFRHTVRMDLDDINENVKDGLHTAAMAGAWLSIVCGFAGMRDFGGMLRFHPYLPREWKRFSFRLAYQGCLLEVEANPGFAVYRLLEGDALTIEHAGRALDLHAGSEMKAELNPRAKTTV